MSRFQTEENQKRLQRMFLLDSSLLQFVWLYVRMTEITEGINEREVKVGVSV